MGYVAQLDKASLPDHAHSRVFWPVSNTIVMRTVVSSLANPRGSNSNNRQARWKATLKRQPEPYNAFGPHRSTCDSVHQSTICSQSAYVGTNEQVMCHIKNLGTSVLILAEAPNRWGKLPGRGSMLSNPADYDSPYHRCGDKSCLELPAQSIGNERHLCTGCIRLRNKTRIPG